MTRDELAQQLFINAFNKPLTPNIIDRLIPECVSLATRLHNALAFESPGMAIPPPPAYITVRKVVDANEWHPALARWNTDKAAYEFVKIGVCFNSTQGATEQAKEIALAFGVDFAPPYEERKPYIGVTRGLRGWYTVKYSWTDRNEGFYEPIAAGDDSYASREEAVEEAKTWAALECLECRV